MRQETTLKFHVLIRLLSLYLVFTRINWKWSLIIHLFLFLYKTLQNFRHLADIWLYMLSNFITIISITLYFVNNMQISILYAYMLAQSTLALLPFDVVTIPFFLTYYQQSHDNIQVNVMGCMLRCITLALFTAMLYLSLDTLLACYRYS